MRKGWFILALVFLWVLIPLSAPAQAQTKIRFSDVGPLDLKTNSLYLMGKIISEELEKHFPGKFKTEYYPSAQLYKAIPAHKAVLAGAIETCYSFEALLEPIFGSEVGNHFNATTCPIFDDFDQYWKACQEITPLLSKEYLEPRGAIIKGKKHAWSGNLFLTKPAKNMAELKGRKVRVSPGILYETLAKAMGLNPVAMDTAEVLAAAQSGTIDGIMSSLGAGGVRLKFYAAAKYVTPSNIPGTSSNGFWFWNLKFWNSLPQEVRDKMDKEILPYAEKEAYKADRLIFDTAWDIITKDGAVQLKWSDAAIKEFYEVAAWPTVEKMTPLIGEKWLKIVKKYGAKR